MLLNYFCYIKKGICILLCCIQFSGFIGHETIKIPDLIAHYLEHSKSEKIGILDFISEHYGKSEHNKKNHHHQLPFKHNINCSQQLTYKSMDSEMVFLTNNFCLNNAKKINLNETIHSRLNQNDIWQPPRMA